MNSQDHGVNLDRHHDNVVAFPLHRGHAQISAERPLARPARRSAVISGAELNARILILLGVCTSTAAVVLSAAHLLQAL